MNRLPTALDWSLWLVRAASLLVPSSQRLEWRQEWDAEIQGAEQRLQRRGVDRIGIRVWRFACGSLADALWHRVQLYEREQFRRELRAAAESPRACLLTLAAILGVVVLFSGLAPSTLDVLLPLPYADADRIATVTQSGIAVATRSGVLPHDSRLWRGSSRTIEDSATYNWRHAVSDGRPIVAATVSEGFFALLGARTAEGHRVGSMHECLHCAVVSYDYWRKHRSNPTRQGGEPRSDAQTDTESQVVEVSGHRYQVAAVLDKNFWFLSRKVGVWTVEPPADWKSKERSGVVVKLRAGVSRKDAQTELGSIVEDSGAAAWDALFEVSLLSSRVHAVLGSFALALALAAVIVTTTLRLRMPSWNWERMSSEAPKTLQAAVFFMVKTALALTVVLVMGLEFTPAASITMLGGTDIYTEPLSTWLYLMGCLGVLTWSVADQRRRCRVCLRRLGMAAHVGCAGSLLLDWAGTELVCIEGHGMLHVPEMEASWREPEQWTALDESWMELFARRG